MDSQIIAEVAIVDCRAFVEVVFSTSADSKSTMGFSTSSTSGAFFGFPAPAHHALRDVSEADLTKIAVTPGGDGLRWDAIDVDLSVPALIQNAFGSKTWMRELGRAGGRSQSPAKARAARANGRKGGRPRKRSARS